jgi:hypothetical protein
MRHGFAYAFTSPLSLGDVHKKLNELGPWRWIERDNDRFGEYLSTRVLDTPDHGMIKVFVEGDRYAINVFLESEDPAAEARFASIKDTVFKVLLPGLGAASITRTEMYE